MKKRSFGLIIIFVLLISVFIYLNNKNKYLPTNDIIGVYVNNELNEEIPSKGSAIFQKAVCDDTSTKVTWDNDAWGLLISNLNKKVKCNLYFYSGQTVFDYDYIASTQTFAVPIDGTYKVELWGAVGASYDDRYHGGNGGYTSGLIKLNKGTNLYVYVGGTNICKEGTAGWTFIGYNGGGAAGGENWPNRNFCGGGGATDIRIENANWDNFDSLKSRIMVAAGGGGANWYTEYYSAIGGAAGGLVSYIGKTNANDPTTGSVAPTIYPSSQTSGPYFGKGVNEVTAGGGGGYYGGNSASWTGGAGGSSFISGHNGCDAIKEESTENNIIHTGQSIHYSNLYFTNTLMIDGEGYKWTDKKEEQIGMPSHLDNSVIMGNSGNGYARITLVSIDE